MNKQAGFTLIEVLLATAIFAVISLVSFSVLDGVIKTKDGVESKQAQLNEIQRAWLIIERDLLQIAWRSMRVEGEGPATNYLYASQDGFDESNQWLSFVRSGWTNPNLLLPRSDLQAVAYRIEDDNFQRLHFNFVDAVIGEEPKVRELIKGVEQMQVQYFVEDKWLEQLPSGAWPAAIELTLSVTGIGEVNRKFMLASKPTPVSNQQTGQSSEGEENSQQENQEQNANDNNGARS